MKSSIIQKVDKEFNEDIKKVMKERIRIGMDDVLKPLSFRQITNYIKKHPAWRRIKTDLLTAPREKRGQITDVFLFMAMAIIIALFFGLFIYAFGSLDNILNAQNQVDLVKGTNTTLSSVWHSTGGQITLSFSTLRILSFVMILGMIFTILLSNFLIRVHPAFFILYLLITIIAVIVAVPLANFYEEMLADPVFGSSLSQMTGTNYIILNLPFIVVVVGIFGAIFLTIGIIKRPDYQQGEVGALK